MCVCSLTFQIFISSSSSSSYMHQIEFIIGITLCVIALLEVGGRRPAHSTIHSTHPPSCRGGGGGGGGDTEGGGGEGIGYKYAATSTHDDAWKT